MCLKCKTKLGKKAKNAEGKKVGRNLFRHPLEDYRHPLKISLPPPGKNPETAPDSIRVFIGSLCIKHIVEDDFTQFHDSSPRCV